MKVKSRDFPDIKRWVDAGWITVTPGNVTDYDYLIEEMHKIRASYTLLSAGYDPHNAWQTVAKLEEDGFPMDKFSQGITSMSAPAKEFERLVKKGEINHGGNPVMRWMMSNVLPKIELNDNLRIKKMSKNQKIDGVTAAVIALGVYLSNPQAAAYSQTDAFMI